MLKKLLIAIAILVVLLIGCGIAGYYFMMRPAYRPGILSTRSDLDTFTKPPSQTSVPNGYWKIDNDTKIRYFTKESGHPVLVIHGGPGVPTMESWAGLDRIEDYRFYYYQQRGCGQSTHPFNRFASSNYYQNMTDLISKLGMEQQLADIERIRRLLKVEKLTLIGHSYGGFLATMYAIEFPERVEKLVLVAPAGVLSLPSDSSSMDTVKKYLGADDQKKYDRWQKDYFDYGSIFKKSELELATLNIKYFDFFTKAAKAKGTPVPANVKTTLDLRLIGGWSTHAIYLSLGRTYDYRSDVKMVRAKTLVVYGDEDVYPPDIYQEYADLIPGAKTSVIENTGHFPFDEKPESFAPIIKDFLDQ